MVETIEQIGDALGVVWALFENEAGELTLAANILLAVCALATAYRCFQAMRPALEAKLAPVIAIGSAITAVFAAVGGYFLVQLASQLVS